MPFDPLSAGVAGAGLIFDFLKNQQARNDAKSSQAFQMAQLGQMLSEARQGRSAAMNLAGSGRQDRFGNATYYDPAQGRWVTQFTPLQQRLIDEGQYRQGRAQIRGAQASQDYDKLRSEYLYNRPETEAQSYADIVNLLNQAQGTGERALHTIMNRFGIRTAGNLPQIEQMDRGPSPGQQLAETMLKARGAALDESLKREAGHTSRYLPALKQFEDTANYVAPLDPTGSEIQSMTAQGLKDMLTTGTEYDKLLANIGVSGGRNVLGADSAITAAGKGGPGASDFLNIAKMLMPGADKTAAGTTGGTRGARASTSGGSDDGFTIAPFDHRRSYLDSTDPDVIKQGYGGSRGQASGPFAGDPEYTFSERARLNPMAVPDYGLTRIGDAADYSGGYFRTPWSF